MQSPIPDPDYKQHPAYGGYFSTPSLSDRVRALLRFTLFLSAYLIFDIINRKSFTKLANNFSSSTASSPLERALNQDGVAAVRLSPPDIEIIHAQLDGFIETVRRKQDYPHGQGQIPWSVLVRKGLKIAFFTSQNRSAPDVLYIVENDAPELFNRLRRVLKREGVLDAANQYLVVPV